MRERALCSRVAEADNKGFKSFKESLDKSVNALQAEVETAKQQVFDLRSNKGASAFFDSASKLLASAKNQKK